MNDTPKTDLKDSKVPVSRFWACVFSPTILALLWTQKMKKTRRWIPIFSIFIVVWFIIDGLLYYGFNPSNASDLTDFLFSAEIEMDVIVPLIGGLLPDAVYSEDLAFVLSYSILVVYDLVIYIGSIALVIYSMFKWTTSYNLENFGYKSKKEWKNARRDKDKHSYEIREKLKKYGNKTADGMSNVASKIKEAGDKGADNIGVMASKIKEAGDKGADNIGVMASKIKYESKASDDEIIKKIRRWYDLMGMGIISESEFETRKRNLLDKVQENT